MPTCLQENPSLEYKWSVSKEFRRILGWVKKKRFVNRRWARTGFPCGGSWGASKSPRSRVAVRPCKWIVTGCISGVRGMPIGCNAGSAVVPCNNRQVSLVKQALKRDQASDSFAMSTTVRTHHCLSGSRLLTATAFMSRQAQAMDWRKTKKKISDETAPAVNARGKKKQQNENKHQPQTDSWNTIGHSISNFYHNHNDESTRVHNHRDLIGKATVVHILSPLFNSLTSNRSVLEPALHSLGYLPLLVLQLLLASAPCQQWVRGSSLRASKLRLLETSRVVFFLNLSLFIYERTRRWSQTTFFCTILIFFINKVD